jgi:hypothetical protein
MTTNIPETYQGKELIRVVWRIGTKEGEGPWRIASLCRKLLLNYVDSCNIKYGANTHKIEVMPSGYKVSDKDTFA